MRIICVNRDPSRLPVPDDWEVWHTTRAIGYTYSQIAKTALMEEWDTDVVVIQDDVRGEIPPAEVFTVYGWKQNHVCPRAFAADRHTWSLLFEAWQSQPAHLCASFTRIAEHAEILNSCR